MKYAAWFNFGFKKEEFSIEKDKWKTPIVEFVEYI
jgi:hypothetical protein